MKKYYLDAHKSKGYFDFILLDRNHNIVEQIFQLANTAEGYRNLLAILERYSNHANATFIVVFESTGGYENRWIDAINSFCVNLKIKAEKFHDRKHSKLHIQLSGNDLSNAHQLIPFNWP
jgi:hypothetical protein